VVGDGNYHINQHESTDQDEEIEVVDQCDRYHADEVIYKSDQDEVVKSFSQDKVNDQDDNQMIWTASCQRQNSIPKYLWSLLSPSDMKSLSSARTRPIQKRVTRYGIRQAQLKAVRAIRRHAWRLTLKKINSQEKVTQKKLGKKKQVQRQLAKEKGQLVIQQLLAKQQLAKEKQFRQQLAQEKRQLVIQQLLADQQLAKEKQGQRQLIIQRQLAKQQLAREKQIQERSFQAKIVQEEKLKKAQQNLAQKRLTQRLVHLQQKLAQERAKMIQAQKIRDQKKLTKLKLVEEASAQEGIILAQQEVTREARNQPLSPDDVLYPVSMPAQPASALCTTQQQPTGYSIRLV